MSGPGAGARRMVVERAVLRLAANTADERLRLRRLHLQATVTRASPLVIDLAAQAGMTIGEVAACLPVPHDWPTGVAPVAGVTRRGRVLRGRILPGGRQPQVSLQTGAQLRRGGVAVRGSADPAGDLGFLPQDDCLEATSLVEGTSLRTYRGDGFIVTPAALPETVLLGIRGRTVDAVVSHAALDGRGYLITDAYREEFGEGSVIRFGTGLVSIELPWADEFAEEERRDREEVASLLAHRSEEAMAGRYVQPGRKPGAAR